MAKKNIKICKKLQTELNSAEIVKEENFINENFSISEMYAMLLLLKAKATVFKEKLKKTEDFIKKLEKMSKTIPYEIIEKTFIDQEGATKGDTLVVNVTTKDHEEIFGIIKTKEDEVFNADAFKAKAEDKEYFKKLPSIFTRQILVKDSDLEKIYDKGEAGVYASLFEKTTVNLTEIKTPTKTELKSINEAKEPR